MGYHACSECSAYFESEEQLEEHYNTAHTADLSAFGGGLG